MLKQTNNRFIKIKDSTGEDELPKEYKDIEVISEDIPPENGFIMYRKYKVIGGGRFKKTPKRAIISGWRDDTTPNKNEKKRILRKPKRYLD